MHAQIDVNAMNQESLIRIQFINMSTYIIMDL